VKHEWIGIGTEFCNDERRTLNHEAGDEGYITRQPVELGNNDGAAGLASEGEGDCQLRATIKRISALACLDLGKLLEDAHALGLGEACDGRALGLDAQA
jgi:hypothetical protein